MTEVGTQPVPPASPDMAAKLAINRAGRLTRSQRRTVIAAGTATGALLLCPLAMVIQMGVLALAGDLPPVTVGGIVFFVVGAVFLALFAGLIGTNAAMFLPEAFGRNPVRSARGPLEIRMTETKRPELPFSYIIGDYSFAPYVVPEDVPMRPGVPYIVYYSARSRLLLSIAALDAPDAAQWQPASKNQGAG
jgi:hypothetical protein